ncbi:glycosyl transferase family 1 [Acinetobacter seifertii]|uniref:glycosyl transferase family 1 n=1 Tax=Acinetobacter seifertii TaxID=1530123 RepID=UPI0018DD113D|nr:glycosyl transferase family 1 [Acinetobacter seifertii]QPV59211.1 glycosyl transferase family 1 [Acinetobacter seifertii]
MLRATKEIGQVILFLSKYPELDEEYRDGFYQRVENIDNFFSEDERIYLNVSLFKNLNFKSIQHNNRLQVSCNLFLHFFYILRAFKKSNLVYIQSIYNALNLILFILFFNKIYILDLHGVVPEELVMQGKIFKSKIFNIVERILFKKIDIAIAVTNAMANHFSKKYKNAKCQYIIYAILPSHLKSSNMELELSNTIEVIYSGNTQVWQNVDLMLDVIKNHFYDNINYTILTGDLVGFHEKLSSHNIDLDKINLKSVSPYELEEYYKQSHYGFILRDDILVNNVACPTKIIEYLNYGIIPIVLTENIGDFKELGYEFLNVTNFSSNIAKQKSKKNIEVIEYIYNQNNINLKEKILSYIV